MISNFTLVELLRWELSYGWVHTVLNLEHSLLISTLEQSLKERSAKLSLNCILAESRGWQLILIANQDDSLWSKLKGNKCRWFDALTSFIYDQVFEGVFCDL